MAYNRALIDYANDVVQVKAGMLRTYLALLEEDSLLSQVAPLLPVPTRELIERPPLISTWVSAAHTEALLDALATVRSQSACEEYGWRVVDRGLVQFVRPLLTSVLKIAGSSPAVFYKRWSIICENSVIGLTSHYEAKGERAGTVTHVLARDTPITSQLAWVGAVGYMFRVCGTKTGVARLAPSPLPHAFDVQVTW